MTVQLGGPVTFSGVLRDRAGTPVPNQLVRLLTDFGGVSASTAADGSFSLTAAPGTYSLGVRRDGSPGAADIPGGFDLFGPSIELTADRVQDLTLQNVFLDVTVVDPDGNPVPNAAVAAPCTGTFFELYPGGSTSGGVCTEGTTNAEGVARLVLFPSQSVVGTVTPPAGSGALSVTFDAGALLGDEAITVTLAGVLDQTPPTIDVPTQVTAEAVGPQGADVQYVVSVTDNRDPSPVVACDPPSGSTFPLGTTVVSCTARDSTGNEASAGFGVIVVDTTPPMLTVPDDAIANAVGPDGVALTWEANAFDTVDGPVAVLCGPPSGSTFSIGTTMVTCSTEDEAGNAASASFGVHVKGADEQIEDLIALVAGSGPGTSLADKLQAATAAVEAGDREEACRAMAAFTNEVHAQSGNKLTEQLAAALIVAANRIRSVLDC